MQALVIGGIVFALCVAVFASQNALPVEIKLIFWTVETPLVVIVIVASALGAILMGLPGWIKQFMTSVKMRKLNTQYKNLKEEMALLQESLKVSTSPTENNEKPKESNFPFFSDIDDSLPIPNNEENELPPTE